MAAGVEKQKHMNIKHDERCNLMRACNTMAFILPIRI